MLAEADRLTNGPLSLLSRGHIEDIYFISSIRFIIRLNVYREFLYKGTGIPERQNGNISLKYGSALPHNHFFY